MEIREIIGNTTTTPNPQADWAQTDSAKANYVKNKPQIETSRGKNSIQQVGYNASNSAQNGGLNETTGETAATFGDSNYNDGKSSLVGGSCNTETVTAGFSIIGGCWNQNNDPNAIVVGFDNTNSGKNGIVGGDSNTLDAPNGIVGGFKNQVRANNSGSLGQLNEVDVPNSLSVGRGNKLNGTDSNAQTYGANLAVGLNNTISGAFGLIAGIGNTNDGDCCIVNGQDCNMGSTVSAFMNGRKLSTGSNGFYSMNSGQNNTVNHWNVLVSGLGLYSNTEGGAVFGTYNIIDTDALLMVGNGTSDKRGNAFVVKKDGSIQIGQTVLTEADLKRLLSMQPSESLNEIDTLIGEGV